MLEKILKFIFNYKLVKIEHKGASGYGVRSGWIIYTYYDFSATRRFWWLRGSMWFSDCITTKEGASKFLTNVCKRKCETRIEVGSE